MDYAIRGNLIQGKKKLLNRVIESFEKDLEQEIEKNIDDRPISRLWLDQIEYVS